MRSGRYRVERKKSKSGEEKSPRRAPEENEAAGISGRARNWSGFEDGILLRRGSLIEDFADFGGEGRWGEGFLDEEGVGFEFAVVKDGLRRVAGHVEDAQAGAEGGELRGEFAAADARHDDVGEKQIDAFRAVATDGNGGLRRIRHERRIARGGKRFAGQFANLFVVFDEENCFRAAMGGGVCLLKCERIGWRSDQGKINLERRAAAGLAINPDVAAVLFEDDVDHREAETRAFADFLGGEKRLKDSREVFRSDAGTGVADGERNVVTFLDGLVARSIRFVERDVRGFDGQLAAGGHGVAGVDD